MVKGSTVEAGRRRFQGIIPQLNDFKAIKIFSYRCSEVKALYLARKSLIYLKYLCK